MDDLCAGWALQHCQGSGCPEPGTFPIMNGWQRNGVRLGGAPLKTPPHPCSLIPVKVPTRPHCWVEVRLLLWWTAQAVEGDGGLPQGNCWQEDILRLPSSGMRSREGGGNGNFLDLGYSQHEQTKSSQLLPSMKTQGQSTNHNPSARVAHLEEKSANEEEDVDGEDPDGIKVMTEEFIICLARAVKDDQQMEKHCYHCDSPDHFIHNCPQLADIKTDAPLNWKEGWYWGREAEPLKERWLHQRYPRMGCPRHKMLNTASLLESWPL